MVDQSALVRDILMNDHSLNRAFYAPSAQQTQGAGYALRLDAGHADTSGAVDESGQTFLRSQDDAKLNATG